MIKPHERIDELFRENMKIIQSREVFSYSVDALLLADFVTLRKRDSIIDLCSGNGVIPLLLSHRTDQPIEGLEIQAPLVDMAKRSIALNGLQQKIEIIDSDSLYVLHHQWRTTWCEEAMDEARGGAGSSEARGGAVMDGTGSSAT